MPRAKCQHIWSYQIVQPGSYFSSLNEECSPVRGQFLSEYIISEYMKPLLSILIDAESLRSWNCRLFQTNLLGKEYRVVRNLSSLILDDFRHLGHLGGSQLFSRNFLLEKLKRYFLHSALSYMTSYLVKLADFIEFRSGNCAFWSLKKN